MVEHWTTNSEVVGSILARSKKKFQKNSYDTQDKNCTKFSNPSFEQLGFNLSNRVTDTLESSSILIYFYTRKSKKWLDGILD